MAAPCAGHWKKGMRHGQGEYVFFVEGKDSVLAGKWVNDEYVGIQYGESAYSIEYRNNIGRVTFNRIGTTPYIRLKFVRGAESMNCELRFEIKEPGSWIVAISL